MKRLWLDSLLDATKMNSWPPSGLGPAMVSIGSMVDMGSIVVTCGSVSSIVVIAGSVDNGRVVVTCSVLKGIEGP